MAINSHFSIADYTKISPDAASPSDGAFSIADYALDLLPSREVPHNHFVIADYLRIDPDIGSSQDSAFSIGDYPVAVEPDATVLSHTRFTIADYLRIDPDTGSSHDSVFSIADYPTSSPDSAAPSSMFFTIAEYNIITTPSPEKLYVWDSDKQQWVHQPRYVWNPTEQEWRIIS